MMAEHNSNYEHGPPHRRSWRSEANNFPDTPTASASTRESSDPDFMDELKSDDEDEPTEELDSALSPASKTMNNVPRISVSGWLIILACATTYWVVTNQEVVASGRHLAGNVFP